MKKNFKTMRVYKLAFEFAMDIFRTSVHFPKEEKYALANQMRRSSRSICSNLAEAYRKRQYPKHFASKLSDADSELNETMVWLDFALACQYMTPEEFDILTNKANEVGKMIGGMLRRPESFLINNI